MWCWMKETNITQLIRLGTADIAVTWRNNVGAYKDSTGRLVRYGLGVGSSDLIGFRKIDARIIAIEVKVPGKSASPEQQQFINIITNQLGCCPTTLMITTIKMNSVSIIITSYSETIAYLA